MTTRERREEYSSSNYTTRVLHPSRPLSPANKSDLDNNLDYLLEDLQQSISRPGSSLSQPIANYSTTKEIQYLSPSNTSTIIRERSTSPNTNKFYKTTKYEYKTVKGGHPDGGVSDLYQQNINQLDTLLSDLERERDSSLERKKKYSSNSGIDSGFLDPSSHVSTTTRTYRTNSTSRSVPVSRELYYDSADSTASRQSRTRQRSPPYEKVVETRIVRDNAYGPDTGIYGGINKTSTPRSLSSPTPRALSSPSGKVERYYTESRTMSSDRGTLPRNVHYGENVETTVGPTAMEHIPVSGDLLPGPKTKVTTTVRTYTYEIPNEDGSAPLTPTHPGQKVVYKNETYNTKTSTLPSGYPERDIPSPMPKRYTSPSPTQQIEMYKNETYNTLNRYPKEPLPSPPQTNTTIYYKKDTRESSTNFYPNQQPHDPYLPVGGPRSPMSRPLSPSGRVTPTGTTIYKYDVTNTTNTHTLPPATNGYPPATNGYPPATNGYPQYPNDRQYPQQSPPVTNTYIYREERNTTNTRNVTGPGVDERYPNERYPNDRYPSVSYPGDRPPHQPRPVEPPAPTTVYKYTTVTNTHNTREREPLLGPAPFPVNGNGPSDVDGQPPKRLDDLLATFGDNTPTQYRQRPVEETPMRPTRVAFDQTDTNGKAGKSVAAVNPNNAASPSKNISGPPVYYPPGHEMFAKKEESGAAWRAQGGYARGSGKYMYESESKSKSSSKSGAAVVPVCLPLCCAMPCSIM